MEEFITSYQLDSILKGGQGRSSNTDLESGTEAESSEGHWHLTCSPWLALLAFFYILEPSAALLVPLLQVTLAVSGPVVSLYVFCRHNCKGVGLIHTGLSLWVSNGAELFDKNQKSHRSILQGKDFWAKTDKIKIHFKLQKG